MNPIEFRASLSLAAVYGLRMLGMFLILPVFALYAPTLEGGESKVWIGFALGAYGLTQALLQLPLGMASDKYGRKKIIYIGLMVFAAGSFMAAVASDIYWLTFARALQGAGAVSAAVIALLADLTRDEVRTRAMAMIGMTIGLTFAVSMVLGPVLAELIGVDGTFTLTGILTILAMGAIVFLVPNPEKCTFHADAQTQKKSLSMVLKDVQLLRLNFGIFALHSAQMALFMAMPLALVKLDLPVSEHWYIYFPVMLLSLVLMVPAIVVGETRNKLKAIFLMAIGLMVIAQLGMAFMLDSLSAIFIWLSLYFVAFNILEASLPSLISKIAPTQAKGTAMGVYNTSQSLGLFMGGVVGGFVFANYGFTGIFVFCSILMIIWFFIALSAPSPLAVKNLVLSVPEFWQHQVDVLAEKLSAVVGVVEIAFSDDKQVVYLKVTQKGFDLEAVQQLILGEGYVSK